MAVSTYLSVITLNVNGLSSSTRRHRVTEWMKKEELSVCCPQKTDFVCMGTHRLEGKGWEEILHEMETQ